MEFPFSTPCQIPETPDFERVCASCVVCLQREKKLQSPGHASDEDLTISTDDVDDKTRSG